MSWETLLSIAPYNWHSIGAAVLCGSLIGMERQIRGKPVGIRTSTLITLGTYLFLSTSGFLEGSMVDPSRVVGQVITGVGFLGAGVMINQNGAIIGVTSAATIWVLAAIGVMLSFGYLAQAIKLSVLVVIILYGFDVVDEKVNRALKKIPSIKKLRK